MSPTSSTTSYYTAYGGTPRSHEMGEVEGMLSGNSARRTGPERAYVSGNMSPPVFC